MLETYLRHECCCNVRALCSLNVPMKLMVIITVIAHALIMISGNGEICERQLQLTYFYYGDLRE